MSDAMSLVARNVVGLSSDHNVNPIEAIESHSGLLPQISLDYEASRKLLWITLRPEPKPVFTLPCVESVLKVQKAIAELWGTKADRPVLFLAYRGRGPVFSLGGDLDFYLDCLSKGDREGLARYAETAAEVIKLNRSGIDGSVLSLSIIHARAMGGGIDPARACNVMIAEEDATFCYPEINYNHFPISAVPILSRHAGFIEAEKILLTGREFTAQEFYERGVVDALVQSGGGEGWVRNYADASMATHSARIALIAAFNRQAGDLGADLARSSESWVAHMATLKPLEISKLQRIAAAQERMLGRLLRRKEPLDQR